MNSRKPTSRRVGFYSFSPNAFPLTLEAYDEASGECLWEATVTDAGALQIPSLHPRKCLIRSRLNTGWEVFAFSSAEVLTYQEGSNNAVTPPRA